MHGKVKIILSTGSFLATFLFLPNLPIHVQPLYEIVNNILRMN